jgi:hypothetical protein
MADFARDLADGAITVAAPSGQFIRNSAADEGAFALALSNYSVFRGKVRPRSER